MKSSKIVIITLLAISALPMLASAEVYKWKDKDGSVRYSDTPPPSNVKQEAIHGKKSSKATNQAPLSPVESTQPVVAKDEMKGKESAGKSEGAEDAAAKLRQKNAEAEKRNKQEKESQAKLKDENCKAAKSNLASYTQGGRVYKMNEKGEREYLDDAGLKDGASKAQKEVAEYCNG